jgi:membrane-associated progesterone receptor component
MSPSIQLGPMNRRTIAYGTLRRIRSTTPWDPTFDGRDIHSFFRLKVSRLNSISLFRKMPVHWIKPLFVAALSVGGIAHALVRRNRNKIDAVVMGFVRDIGRYKAKKRRHQNTKGLVLFLAQQDDPDEDVLDAQASLMSDSNLPTYTATELLEFGDGEDGRPLLLSVFGHVYDVSSGARFYGPGAAYSVFAGRDVTYSLSTGCRTDECLAMSPDDLTEKEIVEGKRWLSFFHLHDKYPLVGRLETDYLEMVLGTANVEDHVTGTESGEAILPPILQ